jgi:hypothetical protein
MSLITWDLMARARHHQARATAKRRVAETTPQGGDRRDAAETRREAGERRRESAEAARIAAENGRVSAETIRMEAMTTVRTTAETLRLTLARMEALEESRRALRAMADPVLPDKK